MYAEIVINRNLPGNLDTLTYELKQNLRPGHTLWVPFRNHKAAGVIISTTKRIPRYEIRTAFDPIREYPLLAPWQIKLAQWISSYYLCPLSKVIPLFLPKKIWEGKNVKTRGAPVETRHGASPRALTKNQSDIINTIKKNPGKTFLIHGVTGSGKTEIYLQLAKEYVQKGAQVLVLVPEIALTPQMIDYFQKHFDLPISVIHSKLSEGQRQREWFRVHTNESKIIIGSRSAVFTPFQNLGLIIMDEEHEWTYKQTDQSPRYHTRDVVEKMNKLLGCTVVMGSATPSVETYYRTVGTERCSVPTAPILLEMRERINHNLRGMPRATIVDLREEIKTGNFSVISNALREQLAATLARKKQAILFINRRGAASATVCRDCGYVVRCPTCFVAMPMHNSARPSSILICHHCGRVEDPPTLCPQCKSARIRYIGVGTQRVEEEIHKLFGLARVLRADRDTTSAKDSFEKIYTKFKNHEADILIGTQIIGKGLDIPQVELVGVILADTSLYFPDFRAAERTFQLLTQVAGRAGRGATEGIVIIQTYNPDHYAIVAASKHNYQKFFDEEIKIRESLSYPPFSKIIKLTYSHPDEQKCINEVKNILTTLQSQTMQSINIQSAPAAIPRLHGKYHWNIFIKGDNPGKILTRYAFAPGWKIDVDPLN